MRDLMNLMEGPVVDLSAARAARTQRQAEQTRSDAIADIRDAEAEMGLGGPEYILFTFDTKDAERAGQILPYSLGGTLFAAQNDDGIDAYREHLAAAGLRWDEEESGDIFGNDDEDGDDAW
jgi:hypothetical protein